MAAAGPHTAATATGAPISSVVGTVAAAAATAEAAAAVVAAMTTAGAAAGVAAHAREGEAMAATIAFCALTLPSSALGACAQSC